MAAPRARGTGSLIVRRDKAGREVYYGKYWVHGRQVMRRLGDKRRDGTREGLTQAQANRELQRRMLEDGQGGPPVERLTLSEVGERYLRQLEGRGLKLSTIQDYRSTLRVHLAPFFSGPINKIDEADVEAFIAEKVAEKKAPKSIRNYLGLLHSLFAYAEKKGWARDNPVKRVEQPRAASGDPDIRFLDQTELDALIHAVPEDDFGRLERVLYLTAAMTGLRQGELIALRWRDVDWPAGKVRVRQNYVRGEFGTPKSKRSSRSVPLADEVAGALDRHFKASAYTSDGDLVFCHPHTGHPLERAKVLRRFKKALRAAGVREVRFHDLRHTFGTRTAAAGVSLRTVQEWMGHRDFSTTLIYADYAPDVHERDLVQRAFARRAGAGAGITPSRRQSRRAPFGPPARLAREKRLRRVDRRLSRP
jgi:integrase